MGYPVRQKPPTETAEITVAFVNERKEGQFSASIKDTNKDLYWVNEKDLHNFKVGERYEIEFSVRQSKNGFVSRTVEVIRHLTPHGHQAGESSEERAAAKVSDVRTAVQQSAKPQSTSAPRAIAYNNNPGAAVMGMVNQYVGRGDVPLDSDAIARAINECLAGYLKSKLGEAA